MTKIQEKEIELNDAELHLQNCRTYIELTGSTWTNLNMYLEAHQKVTRLREELVFLRRTQG